VVAVTVITVPQLAGRLAKTGPRLGRTRLIAVDGRSGAGKTWLAGELATPLGAPVIHMDDLYPGWDGLTKAADVLAEWIIEPLSKVEPARWRRFDWDTMSYAEWHTTEPADVVILEGCGSIRSSLASAYATRIWVEAPTAARQQRLRARPDWAAYDPHADRWAELEDQLYETEHTRQHCNVVVENPQPSEDVGPSLSLQIRGPLVRPEPAARRWRRDGGLGIRARVGGANGIDISHVQLAPVRPGTHRVLRHRGRRRRGGRGQRCVWP
jgi:uridine kinase